MWFKFEINLLNNLVYSHSFYFFQFYLIPLITRFHQQVESDQFCWGTRATKTVLKVNPRNSTELL